MVTNTPVGVLAAIVILPSCLNFTVVHRLLRQTSTCRDHGRKELCDRRLSLDDGKPEVIPGQESVSPKLVRHETTLQTFVPLTETRLTPPLA